MSGVEPQHDMAHDRIMCSCLFSSLLALYRQLLPTLGGYICDAGHIDLTRVAILLGKLGSVEEGIFKKRRKKQMWHERK